MQTTYYYFFLTLVPDPLLEVRPEDEDPLRTPEAPDLLTFEPPL